MSAKGIPRSQAAPVLSRLIARHKVNLLTECWEWQGYCGIDGYGVIGMGSRSDGTRTTMLVHRVSYSIFVEDVPEDINILHKCDNPPCFNPMHLFKGTQLDNIRDMISKGRKVVLRGEQVGTSKLTKDQVIEIKKKLAYRNNGELSMEYGVSDSLIDFIRQGKAWRHIK